MALRFVVVAIVTGLLVVAHGEKLQNAPDMDMSTERNAISEEVMYVTNSYRVLTEYHHLAENSTVDLGDQINFKGSTNNEWVWVGMGNDINKNGGSTFCWVVATNYDRQNEMCTMSLRSDDKDVWVVYWHVLMHSNRLDFTCSVRCIDFIFSPATTPPAFE